MPVSQSVTGMFLESLHEWVEGARSRDTAKAAFNLQQLRIYGELMAQHPEFDLHDGGRTPVQVLDCLLHWLDAALRSHAAPSQPAT